MFQYFWCCRCKNEWVYSWWKIFWLFFSFNLDLGFNTVSIVKTTLKNIGALMPSLKLLPNEIVPYPWKLIIRNTCSDAPNFCFDEFDEPVTLDTTSELVQFRLGVVVITTVQLYSARPKLTFCAASNPDNGVLVFRDGEDLWQWSELEIRLNIFRGTIIPQKRNSTLFIWTSWICLSFFLILWEIYSLFW